MEASMAEQASPVWWVELIKISPGLITAGLAVGLVVAYRKELGALIRHMTKFKALGIEAEFDARPSSLSDFPCAGSGYDIIIHLQAIGSSHVQVYRR
jgi:hypothetical protein